MKQAHLHSIEQDKSHVLYMYKQVLVTWLNALDAGAAIKLVLITVWQGSRASAGD